MSVNDWIALIIICFILGIFILTLPFIGSVFGKLIIKCMIGVIFVSILLGIVYKILNK